MSSADTSSRIWLLALVPNVSGGRWITGLTIFALLITMFSLAGVFAADAPAYATPGVSLFFAAILSYIIPVVHFITERAQRALQDLAGPLQLDAESLAEETRRVSHRSRRWTLLYGSAGIIAAGAHNLLLFSFVDTTFQGRLDALGLSNLIGGALVWIVMTFAITSLVDIALQFNRLARKAEVDLLDPSALTPFGHVAVISTLAMIGAQASFPLMWIDQISSAVTMVPGLVATAVPMVLMFALPVWPVHRRMAAAKLAELQRIRGWIDSARGANAAPAEPQALQRLVPLLSYRNEIEHLSEWPFNATLLTRLGFYLVIPPLTWIGAALMEIVLVDVV
jgi:hypothetical protein